MKKMTLVDKAFHLKNTSLFRMLDLDLLLPIADQLGLSEFVAEKPIFEKGDEAHLMYFIVQGKVRLEMSEGHCQLSEGDYFGDEALFSGESRGYAVNTLGTVSTLTLSRAHLLAIIAECPSVALAFLQTYASQHPLLSHSLSEEIV